MTDFVRQTSEPLFPNVLWDKPVNKKAAKQLLIIGGHAKHFQSIQTAYLAALQAGIGAAKVVMPDVLKPTVGDLPDALFVPSTPSGSISKSALNDVNGFASDSDGILLVGDLSNNTDTVSFLESVLTDIDLPIALTTEIIITMLFNPNCLVAGDSRLVITNTQTLVRLAETLDLELQIQRDANLLNKVALLKSLYQQTHANFALRGTELIIAADSQVSVTPSSQKDEAKTAAFLATFWLQNLKAFEGLTTAAHELSKTT